MDKKKKLLIGLGIFCLALLATNPSTESFYYYAVGKTTEEKECVRASREFNLLLFSIYETRGQMMSGTYLGILGNYIFVGGQEIAHIDYCKAKPKFDSGIRKQPRVAE